MVGAGGNSKGAFGIQASSPCSCNVAWGAGETVVRDPPGGAGRFKGTVESAASPIESALWKLWPGHGSQNVIKLLGFMFI